MIYYRSIQKLFIQFVFLFSYLKTKVRILWIYVLYVNLNSHKITKAAEYSENS